jgi:hypothetical protein
MVNALSPGIVNSDLSRFLPKWQKMIAAPIQALFFRSPESAAEGIVFAATSPSLRGVTGRFLRDGVAIVPSESAQSLRLAKSVWSESEKLLGV